MTLELTTPTLSTHTVTMAPRVAPRPDAAGETTPLTSSHHDDLQSNTASDHNQGQHLHALDSVCCHFLFQPFACCCEPIIGMLHRIRWHLARPLLTPIIPRSCSRRVPGRHITYGQVLLNLPIALLLPAAIVTCFKSTAVSVDISGFWATLAMWASFFTANKSNSFASFLFGISFEQMIPPHYLASALTLILGVFHGYLAYERWGVPYELRGNREGEEFEALQFVNYNDTTNITTLVPDIGTDHARNGSHPNAFWFALDGWINWSGTYLTLAFGILVLSSVFPLLRRRFYTEWFATHILSSLIVLYFAHVHFGISKIIMITWGLDLFVRYVVMALCRYPQEATLSVIADDVVCILWKRTKWFSYNAGQFVKIAIPELSTTEFHPMSIASAPYEDTVRVYVRVLGPWTKQLLELGERRTLGNEELHSRSREVGILLEGPYGCLSEEVINPSFVLFICGGIGITPCQSMALSLLFRKRKNPNRSNLVKLRFVWAVREIGLIDSVLAPTLLDNEQMSSAKSGDATSIVQTDIYHTRGHPSKSYVARSPTASIYSGTRPDLDEICKHVKIEALRMGISNVTMVCCGPTRLVDEGRELCRSHSDPFFGCTTDSSVSFELHEEMYEF